MPTPPPSAADYRKLLGESAALARAGQFAKAAALLQRATTLQPGNPVGWRALGDVCFAAGERDAANAAHLRAAAAAAADPGLAAAERALKEGRSREAYTALRERVAKPPTDIVAARLLATVALAGGQAAQAVALLDRTLRVAPGYEPAWQLLADALHRLPAADALAAAARGLEGAPTVPGWRTLHAAMLERAGDYAGAAAALERLVADHPQRAGGWIALGHIRKTLGDAEGAAAAYRQAIAVRPDGAEAYWALSDMKAARFTEAEVAAMRALAERADLPAAEREHLGFALGRALEVAGDAEGAWSQYAAANAGRRARLTHDRTALDAEAAANERLLTAGFFAERTGFGCPAPDPIFVVGLPRSGSTLVEQMLASHPDIEATRELDELPLIAAELARRGRLPEVLATLAADEAAALGQAYLDRVAIQRRLGRRFFVDKLPANFRHVGLIRLILPHAKVIDVRREPFGNGWSIFKQSFGSGSTFAYDLGDIAAWRAGYERMMAHWDAVLPGFVHRLDYEALVADTEGEVRRLLGFIGLPFDPAVLAFHQTARPIRTPSGDQVRRPIDPAADAAWRPYAAWLAPLGPTNG